MSEHGDGPRGERGTGHPGPDRVARLASDLQQRDVDALLVTAPVNVRYLTGFTGSHGLALIAREGAEGSPGQNRFFTDFRYATQSAEQLPEMYAREIVAGDMLEAVAATLRERGGRLGYDEAHLTVKAHRRLTALLGEGWELVGATGAVERLRAVKDPAEIASIRAAAQLADQALRETLELGIVGRTERDVAIELELRMRRLGADAPSFSSIVAAGSGGALPHAEPRAEAIPRDVLVTIDWGAEHEGYCSDCTRTFATGEQISAEAREVYELVLSAQERGLAAVRAGPTGREVDAVAREVIVSAGHGEHFGHGLGHGVGMEIHEGPRMSQTAGEEPLRAGHVVTVEPGVYIPGRLGVRIEDLVVVGDDSHEVLTSLPKALTDVS
ncbi:MAG: aminopeptidase family protein [Solirubrobacterales bacterium]|nr:aminopeptidase family protein [Solirubrobacterales bacterium]